MGVGVAAQQGQGVGAGHLETGGGVPDRLPDQGTPSGSGESSQIGPSPRRGCAVLEPERDATIAAATARPSDSRTSRGPRGGTRYRSRAPIPRSSSASGSDSTARNGVRVVSASVKTGHLLLSSVSSATTLSPVRWAVRQGPSPTVNCNRSASAAVTSLAPTGSRRSGAKARDRLAPSTGSARAAARASRSGSSSSPGRAASAAVSAESNSARTMAHLRRRGRCVGARGQARRTCRAGRAWPTTSARPRGVSDGT